QVAEAAPPPPAPPVEAAPPPPAPPVEAAPPPPAPVAEAAPPPPPAAAPAAAPEQELPPPSPAAPSGPAVASTNEAAPVHVTSRTKRLAWVGFRATDSQVFIRTNEPVYYSVADANDGSVQITIQNTRIRRHNDTRPLDTHFFSTPVAWIRARQVRRDVVVEIRLKNRAAYHAVQNGPEVDVRFDSGGSAQADASAPPAG
ncbi:MAG: AMIN domain-containing protein, partial [Deltaproteobacteria bacterium]